MTFPIRVTDVMQRPVHTVTPVVTASEAAQRCNVEQIGSVVVIEDDKPVGIVTNADFVRLLGSRSEPEARTVREFMTSPVITIEPDVSLRNAIQTMQENDISRLVVREDEAIVGIMTTDDIAHVVPQILHRSELTTSTETHHLHRIHRETAYEHPDWEVECVSTSEQRVTVGDRVTFGKTLTEQDVRTFAAVSGDTNRLHLDDEFASSTRFRRRIVHGTLVSSLISAALARLPGVTIYVSQDLSFLSPVDIGDHVTATCEVVEELNTKKYTLTTDVFDEEDEQVIEGQAVVLIDRLPEAASIETEALS